MILPPKVRIRLQRSETSLKVLGASRTKSKRRSLLLDLFKDEGRIGQSYHREKRQRKMSQLKFVPETEYIKRSWTLEMKHAWTFSVFHFKILQYITFTA